VVETCDVIHDMACLHWVYAPWSTSDGRGVEIRVCLLGLALSCHDLGIVMIGTSFFTCPPQPH